ncbi:hypothetical protein PINS_up013008 [Pythium insidiosum]|nr:hypothetical protein PINS_up013008 [Pythium insidiosum]
MKLLTITTMAMVALGGALAGKSHHRHHPHMHGKFYVTPLGKQCAYNPSIDPTMYPCQGGGVCVRFNETYGKCLTQEEADAYAAAEEEDDEEDGGEEDEVVVVIEVTSDGTDSGSDDASEDAGDEEEDGDDESEDDA